VGGGGPNESGEPRSKNPTKIKKEKIQERSERDLEASMTARPFSLLKDRGGFSPPKRRTDLLNSQFWEKFSKEKARGSK